MASSSSSSSSSSSYRELLATVKVELLEARGAPQSRTLLFQALDLFLDDFRSFLVLPGPKAEDRAQVANSASSRVGNRDIQIALKLSDDFNLNEVYSLNLVLSTLEKESLHDPGHLDLMRTSAGLWFSERDSLISSLQLLLQAVALDKELDTNFIAKIQLYIEKFLAAGLRTRLMSLIKELNEEGASGIGDYGLETFIKDSTGALVDRCVAIQRTRLSLCHCLYLSCLVAPLDGQELKDLYNLLRICSGDGDLLHDATKLQITYTIMFSLTNALVSGAQGPEQTGLMLGLDASVCQEFQQLIMDISEFTAITEGFTGIIRLAWVIIRSTSQQISVINAVGSVGEGDEMLRICLNRACDHGLFGFLNTQVFKTTAFQNDERATVFEYTATLCKLTLSLLRLPAGRQKIMEMKFTSMVTLNTRINHMNDTLPCGTGQPQNQALKLQAEPLVSFLRFAREIFQRGPELVINNNDLWSFVCFVGEGHTSYLTLVSFLDMLTALAECKEGAGKVYDLLQRSTISNLGWQNLLSSLVVNDQQLQLCLDTTRTCPPTFQEGDARVVEAYLKILEKVIEKGDALERMQWFEDIEPLFKMLPRENVPPFLKGALRNAIAACASVSSVMKEKVCSLLEQYDLPVSAPPYGSGRHSMKLFYNQTYELNEVEARLQEYPSTISYLKLRNLLAVHELDTKKDRYCEIFQFVRDQVFGLYNQRLYANPTDKWELVVAALHHFKILLKNHQFTSGDARNKADKHALSVMTSTLSATTYTSTTPAMELMKDLKNGEVVYYNIMSIFMLGVESMLEQRKSELYGPILEEATSLSFQIVILAFQKESLFVEAWYPSHQSLHEIIFQNSHQVVALLEYVRYDKSQVIQRYSVKVMELLSSRVPQLVSVLQKAEVVLDLMGGYAACLEARFLEAHPPDNSDEDIGYLILRILLVNLCEPSPNLTHLLLGFDINQAVENTTLQPNRQFSCLTVILHALDKLARPDVNTGLHELGFKLLYELCVDPITCGPMVDLLRNGKYDFLPKRTSLSSHDSSLERGNSSFSETYMCSSEAQPLEVEPCNFEPAAGSAPETPSNSKPEVGFFNPEPLATRCTTKNNDGSGGGSLAALRSSWIQRLFPGMLGQTARPSQWRDKGKHIASDYDYDDDHLLIEDPIKLADDPGPSQRVKDQGKEIRYGDLRPDKREEGSSLDISPPCYNSSQPPTMVFRQGLPSAKEAVCIPGGETTTDIRHLYENPQEPIGFGSQVASADRSGNFNRFTKELFGNRSTFEDLHAHEAGPSKIRGMEYAPFSTMEQEVERNVKPFLQPSQIPPADLDTRSMQVEQHHVEQHLLSSRFGTSSKGYGTSNKPVYHTESPDLRFKTPVLQPGGSKHNSNTDHAQVERATGDEGPKVDKCIGRQGQHQADIGVSMGLSALPPLSLFAPFKHNRERQLGKKKLAAGLSEDSLLTPLFPSCGYKEDPNDNLGGEEKFDSTLFALYKPSSSIHHSFGLCGIETPFAPFKVVEEQNCPSTSLIKTNALPLDLMEHDGEDTKMDTDVLPEPRAHQADHKGQFGNSSRAYGRTSSIYSSSPLPVIADQREGTMSPPNFVPHFNGGQHRLGAMNVHGSTSNTVNTTAIELSSKRPSLHEARVDNKDVSTAQSFDEQLIVSQGMGDHFEFDQDLQQQHLNHEARTARDLRPSVNLVGEASSGSSPVPGGAVPRQRDGIKVETASKQKHPMQQTEDYDVRRECSLRPAANYKLSLNAEEEKSGRASRKRSHESQLPAVETSEMIPLAVPQDQSSAELEPRATAPSPSWLQRWMPSSKPSGAVFKASQACASMPSRELSSHAKNRRVVQDSIVPGGQLDDASLNAPEQFTTLGIEKAGQLPGSTSDSHHRRSSPLFPVIYPVPSAAAMALVGAASKRGVPLPPRRVGTRTAVWPAVAGIQLRRTESGTSGTLP